MKTILSAAAALVLFAGAANAADLATQVFEQQSLYGENIATTVFEEQSVYGEFVDTDPAFGLDGRGE